MSIESYSTCKPGLLWREPTATNRDWRFFGAAGAGLGLVCGWLSVAMVVECSGSWFLALVAAALWAGAATIVRHYPMLSLLLLTLGGAALLVGSDTPVLLLVAVPVFAFYLARWIPGERSRLVLLVGVVASVLGPCRWIIPLIGMLNPEVLLLGAVLTLVCFACVLFPYMMGRTLRHSDERKFFEHRRQVEQLELQVATEQQRVIAAEAQSRNAIARELHDIIAHSLSIIIVQAEGARALATKKPEAAVTALDTIAETGRDALSEARRMVGVLRRDPHAPGVEYSPAPTLNDIPELVSRSGDNFTFASEGAVPPVSSTTGLAAYRIVQEAITNVHKHAGPQAHGEVRLTYCENEILIDITDDGIGSQATTDGHGNGVRGMHERAMAAGGFVVAQPNAAGGFTVQASLPVSPSTSLR
ncbi:MAG: sensor histidine kinase [Propionibacteriaceae bacterium]